MSLVPPSPARALSGVGRAAAWRRRAGAFAVCSLAAGACQGPSLGGFAGLQRQVTSFYRANATERQMTCTLVTMTPVAAEVVEDTPQRVVMDVRYRWTAERQRRGRGFGPGHCNGWAERTFTLARDAAGGLRVVGMTGEQRR